MSALPDPPWVILQVEDDESDVFLIRHAFGKAGIPYAVRVVPDGEVAVEYIAGKGSFGNRTLYPAPTLVLLDLKMPKLDGFEVLRWIRADPNHRHLPVIILSSSAEARDVEMARSSGANSYVVKPLSVDARVDFVEAIRHYWLTYHVTPRP